MRSWASKELQSAALPDKRLNQRLIKIVENLAQQPHASVPQASPKGYPHSRASRFAYGDWANTKATYNYMRA